MITINAYDSSLIPPEATVILNTLYDNGYEAYLVGGCVRDMYMGKIPHDWDITTNAKPDEVIKIFGKDYNLIELGKKFGTIAVVINNNQYEITTYRTESGYTDSRHPTEVCFEQNLSEDLKRRDFTMNAMAYSPKTNIVDIFGGTKSIDTKTISCVGNPNQRFTEDALRILRALRFSAQFKFNIDSETKKAIFDNKALLKNISVERINTELCKILMSRNCGAEIFREFAEVFSVFIPQIEVMIGFKQNNKYHKYDVWEHTLHCMEYESDIFMDTDIIIRLAVLFHDIGKPHCYTEDDNKNGHFCNHQQISAEITTEILKSLKFSNDIISKVTQLILYHNIDFICKKSYIKRLLNKINAESIRKLIILRKYDLFGQNRTDKELDEIYTKLDLFEKMLDEILEEQSCFSLKDLAVNGKDLINIGFAENKNIGKTLNVLLGMVIDEKTDNTKESLIKIARELNNTDLQ